jgi:hypothetical protein
MIVAVVVAFIFSSTKLVTASPCWGMIRQMFTYTMSLLLLPLKRWYSCTVHFGASGNKVICTNFLMKPRNWQKSLIVRFSFHVP